MAAAGAVTVLAGAMARFPTDAAPRPPDPPHVCVCHHMELCRATHLFLGPTGGLDAVQAPALEVFGHLAEGPAGAQFLLNDAVALRAIDTSPPPVFSLLYPAKFYIPTMAL